MELIYFISFLHGWRSQVYRSGLQNRYSWVQIPLCAYLKKIKIFSIIYLESDKETHSNKNLCREFNLKDKIQNF